MTLVRQSTRLLQTTVRQAAQRRAFHSTPTRYDHFINADAETFKKVVSNKDKVVLVDFYAEWCNPCKLLSPILEKLTSDESFTSGSGKPLDLVTIDTDAQIELAQQFRIRSLPTVVAFKDGIAVSQFMGAIPEASVRKFLEAV